MAKRVGYETVFSSDNASREADRLDDFAATLDPITTEVLTTIGVHERQRCLEVGPGTGTIARWLSQHGADVTALDRDLRVAAHTETSNNITWMTGDITQDDQGEDFVAGFDLIHARLVCCWTPQPADVVGRLASWLNPGGVLVIGDPIRPNAAADPTYGDTLHRAINMIEATGGADFSWAWRLPAAMRHAGLRRIGCRIEFPPIFGGDVWARAHVNSLHVALATAAEGLLPDEKAMFFTKYLSDPTTVDVGLGIYYAIGVEGVAA